MCPPTRGAIKTGLWCGDPPLSQSKLADLVCETSSAKRRACEHCIRDPAAAVSYSVTGGGGALLIALEVRPETLRSAELERFEELVALSPLVSVCCV